MDANLVEINQQIIKSNRNKFGPVTLSNEGNLCQVAKCSQLLKNALSQNISSVADHLERRITSLQSFLVLDDMRRRGELCDAEIQVDNGTVFPVHRVILIAASSYFRALFTNGMNDTGQKIVCIHEINADIMELLIGKLAPY